MVTVSGWRAFAIRRRQEAGSKRCLRIIGADVAQVSDKFGSHFDLLKAGVTREKVQLIGFTVSDVEFAQKIALRHKIFNGFIVVNYSCVHHLLPGYGYYLPIN